MASDNKDVDIPTISACQAACQAAYHPDWQKSDGRCSLRVTVLLTAVLTAVLVAALVALLVFFLHPDRNKDSQLSTETTTQCDSCSPTTTTLPTPSVEYRLPNNLVPYFYDVRLRPNFYYSDPTNKSYTNGSVTIHFGVLMETKSIVLHTKKMTVDRNTATLKTAGGDKMAITGTSYDAQTEFYTISLEEGLQRGQNYTLYLEYNSTLAQDLTGIYLSKYKDSNGTDVYIVTSQAQATEARKMFPCFDEPALKAVFNITVERKRGWTSFSNSKALTSYDLLVDSSDDWVADVYLPTPSMSTYLLALVISQFDCVNRTSKTSLVSICARKEYISQTEFANSIAVEMQEYFEDYYNITYPLEKMDHMAVPDFSAGAMENWGLILYRETALLFDKTSSSAFYRQRVAIVVAHELAHQWFGNLVTPHWWDDIWLNEGFASYMEIICTHNSFPDWDMDGQFVVDDLHSVFAIDSLVTSHPVYQPVNDPAQINELFDSIAYSKGASIIRMMHHFLGDDIFRLGISEYLKSRSYQAAHHLDLFSTLTETVIRQARNADINVTEIMQTWLLQLGFPVVSVTYVNKTGELQLTQEHFLLDRRQRERRPESPYSYQWIVPISVVDSENADFDNATQDWLKNWKGTLSTVRGAAWIIVNSKQQYYYRVNYDNEVWNGLTEQLRNNHTVIHSNNRAQLIDDSFNLGRAGYLDMTVFLELSKYLLRESDYVPWRATWKNVDYMRRMFEMSSSYQYLAQYIRQQVEPIYSTLGWSTSDDDKHLIQRHRSIVLDLACSYGREDCVSNATKVFSDWMKKYKTTTNNTIDPNVRAVAYCSAIAAGGSPEWQFAWDRFLEAPSSSEATTLLQALACTKELHLLSGFLDKALSGEGVRLQDFRTVVSSVADNPVGRWLAWSFVRDNWDQLLGWFRSSAFTLPRMIEDVTRSFSTNRELEELKYFRDNAKDLATGRRAVDQAIENTQFNIEWRIKNEYEVVDWLKKQLRA